MNLRVLLVEPPFYRLYHPDYGQCRIPLGLVSLAAVLLAETGVEVRIFHADFHPAPVPFDIRHLTGEGFAHYRRTIVDSVHPAWDELRHAVRSFQPDLVGVSVKTPAWASALACARLVRAQAPRAFLLAGGPHPSAVGGEALATPEFDAVAIGEGESTLVELVRKIAFGGGVDGIPGLLTRNGGYTRRPWLENLDALPFSHVAALKTIQGVEDWPASAFGHVFAARGCPHACAYCASATIWGRRPRLRSAGSVAHEVADLRRLGVGHVHFDDDTFGLTRRRLLALCAALEPFQSDMTFSCETHVHLVTSETAVALARVGFTTVQIGLESGDETMLRSIGKGFGVERALAACRSLKDAGLRLEVFFMAGFPDETAESLAATRKLMERCGADKIIYSIFTPYPGTALYERCRELGLAGPGYDYSRHNHQSPENCFCPGLGSRFRGLAAEMEAFVAEHNAARRSQSPNGA